ncbi:MAG: tetratricopeptide repeat protein [Proteobacteria bacterium]|nr:tetratricopeptide repeat protein [Pseudomonadota bacterium]
MTGAVQNKRLRRAISLKQAGDLEAAEQQFNEIVRVSPDWGEAWLQFGMLLFAASKSRETLRAFRRATGDPDVAPAAFTALSRLITAGSTDTKRRRLLCQALVLHPGHISALEDLVAEQWGEVKSLGWFIAALPQSLEDEPLFQELIARGRMDRARALVRMVLVVRPVAADMLVQVANDTFVLEDFETSAAMTSRLAVLCPSDIGLQLRAVDALFQIEDLDRSEHYARRALEINSARPEVWFRLGRVLRAGQRFDEAHAALAKAGSLDPLFAIRAQIVEQGISPADFTDGED